MPIFEHKIHIKINKFIMKQKTFSSSLYIISYEYVRTRNIYVV